jgi:hypothetical protein
MQIESPRALVTFDPDHPKGDDFVLALRAKLGSQAVGVEAPGVVVVVLRDNAPDADALFIMEESVGQDCPAHIAYPRLYR